MIIKWITRLPEGAELVVRSGQKVKEGEEVYRVVGGRGKKVALRGWGWLGFKEREELRQKYRGIEVVEGEVLWRKGWWQKKEIRAPLGGKCVDIDEFGNMVLSSGETEKYLAPVSARKIGRDKDKVVFELQGKEMEVKGLTRAKGWGNFKGRLLERIDEFPEDIRGEVVVVNGGEALVAKAMALGAAGVILIEEVEDNEWMDEKIPVVAMNLKLIKGLKKSKMWLNPVSGKLIEVLE